MQWEPVLVVGMSVWGIYKLFELFVKRKERLAIIDKIDQLNSEGFKEGIKFPLVIDNNSSRFSSLKISLLMIGIGLGCLIAFILHTMMVGNINFEDHYMRSNFYEIKAMIYFSCITIFGGIGLLTSYLIETNQKKKEQ